MSKRQRSSVCEGDKRVLKKAMNEDVQVLNEEESELYDRQIRLWGAQAQKRISGARVLIAGFNGLGAEIAKNLALAGIGRMVIMTTSLEVRSRANFFSYSVDKVRELNPLISVEERKGDLSEVEDEWFEQFGVVVCCNASMKDMKRLDGLCRHFSTLFLGVGTHGYSGYMLADVLGHEYMEKREGKPGVMGKVEKSLTVEEILACDWTDLSEKKRRRLPQMMFGLQVLWKFEEEKGRYPLQDDVGELLAMRNKLCEDKGKKPEFVDDSTIARLPRECKGELSPVCAIVGGIVGQQAISLVSANSAPMVGFFLYDSEECVGRVHEWI